jgi:hypothetical protein
MHGYLKYSSSNTLIALVYLTGLIVDRSVVFSMSSQDVLPNVVELGLWKQDRELKDIKLLKMRLKFK